MSFHFNQGDRPLPGYTIQRGIGTGGFGEVYYATSDGGKEVALKYLRDNPQVELRGATHCLNLKSPHLVALHDIKQSPNGDFFVIMEYVNGPTLRDLMNAEPQGLGPQKAAYFLREIGKGLAYLHDRGIVHRDLKPGNIFYEDGYVKIGDYGLSKIMAASQHSGQTMSVGTVHYMAPEVGSGNYDRTIDVYALGVILYEMLLGRVPFSGASMGEVLMKHLTAQPEVDELPEPFPRVIRKALAKDPNDRYQTVSEMVSELFEIENLSRSVAAFEPASLSTLAARAARDVNVTFAAPGGGPTVAAVGTGSSNVGQAAPPPVIDPAARHSDDAGRYGPRANRIRRSAERIADRIDAGPIGQKVSALAGGTGNVAYGVTLSAIICAGISAAVMVLKREDPAYAAAVFIHCAAIVGGILFAYRRILRRTPVAPGDVTHPRRRQLRWSHRAMSVGFVAMALGLMNTIARKNGWAGGDSRHWIGAIILAVIFCDWYGRVVAGQLGRVSLGSALTAGMFGFVAGSLAGHGDWLPVAGMLAAASLSIQTLARAWPVAAQVPPEASPPPDVPRAQAAVAVDRGFRGTAGQAEQHHAGTPAEKYDWRMDRAPGYGYRRLHKVWDSLSTAFDPRALVSRGRPGSTDGRQAAEGFASRATPVPVRARRSTGARVAWSLLAGLLLFAMIFAFVLPTAMNLHGDEFAAAIIVGIVLANYSLFALWCVFPRFKKGLWRGVFRKAIFFTGTAVSGGCGAAMGLLNPHNEAFLVALAGILLGGIIALFVWFVPVPPYVPSPEQEAQDREEDPELRSARRLLIAGIISLTMLTVVVPTLLATVPEHNRDEVLPPVVFPLVIFGLVATITGFTRRRIILDKLDKSNGMELPIRREFLIDSIDELDSLLERHMALYGYSLKNRGDLFWWFTRGDWKAQFYQSDIRRRKTDLTIAAYKLPQAGYRLTCNLDVDMSFLAIKRTRLKRLHVELDDLRELLGAREVPDRTPEPTA